MATAAKSIDVNKLVQAYVNIREARRKLSAEFEEADKALKAKQALLDNTLLQHMQDTNQESARTKAGTAFITKDEQFSCADWNKLYKWIEKTQSYEATQKRLNKTFIQNYMEANKGKLPPAVNMHSELVVKVRTANAKG